MTAIRWPLKMFSTEAAASTIRNVMNTRVSE